MEQGPNPIQRIRERISPETKQRVALSIEEANERKKKVDSLMEKIQEKQMQKVHVNFILLNSGLPHDFIQGYFTGDEDYLYTTDYDLNNLKIIEEGVDNFDIKRDEGKMFPTSGHHHN